MSNRIVYIMRGLPGSGKSTMAKNMAGATGSVVSADDFFMAMFEKLLRELPQTPPWWNHQVLTPVVGS